MPAEPRDILADRIATWIEDADAPYPYADTLLSDLDRAGYTVVRTADLDTIVGRTLDVWIGDS